MKGTILAFGLEEMELLVLKELCGMAGLEQISVDPADFGSPLGALVGLTEKSAPVPHEPLSEKMLVFCFVPDFLLESVLDVLRAAGVAPGSYKAVLTENNVAWTPTELFAELRRERRELEEQ